MLAVALVERHRDNLKISSSCFLIVFESWWNISHVRCLFIFTIFNLFHSLPQLSKLPPIYLVCSLIKANRADNRQPTTRENFVENFAKFTLSNCFVVFTIKTSNKSKSHVCMVQHIVDEGREMIHHRDILIATKLERVRCCRERQEEKLLLE